LSDINISRSFPFVLQFDDDHLISPDFGNSEMDIVVTVCECDFLLFRDQERNYCISEPYVATRENVFEIFRILKVLKRIILDIVERHHPAKRSGEQTVLT